MGFFLRLICIALVCVCITDIYAQKKDSTLVGTLEGSIRDSVYNFDLQSATLAIYRVSDSSLIIFSLADNYGAFNMQKLPLDTLLRLTASYVGYKNKDIFIRISKDTKKYVVPTINMERSNNDSMDEVVVKSTAPIQMNGDTLEFNADAFHLDKNAVVEDLLKKIPNVTVWGDGSITVNGKEIKSLKVDGKPFMGGNNKLALQNIAKGAVDKIQVYQVAKNESNQMDSTAEINIKLKANMKTSSFGKIGFGIGTDSRYTADGNFIITSGKTQIGFSASTNNVNETSEDTEAQLRNGTFKGVNASPEYQPDFSRAGTNKFAAGGIMLQHDFVDNPTWNNSGSLNADYFLKSNNQTVDNRTNTLSLLGDNRSQTTLANFSTYSTDLSNKLSAKYEQLRPQNGIELSLNGNTSDITTENNQQSQVFDESSNLVSTNTLFDKSENHSKKMTIKASYLHKVSGWISDYSKRFPSEYKLDYSFEAGNNNIDQIRKTDFVSMLFSSQNQLVDRRYNTEENRMLHSLNGSWGDFIPWIFGQRNFLRGTSLKLTNRFAFITNRRNAHVTDWDTTLARFIDNSYLTNDNRYTTIDEQPGTEISKNFSKSSTNRYNKGLTITLSPKWRYFNQKNTATQLFQNFSKSYTKFTPSASLSFYNNQYGAYYENLSFNYSIQTDMPNLNQLYPLVDSSNITYLSLGNPNLKPTQRQELSVNFNHRDQHNGKSAFNYSLNTTIGKVDNFFADSSYTDSIGRTRHYTVNANGNKYLEFSGNLNKSFKMTKNHQLQIQFNTNNDISRTPNNVNNVWNISNTFSSNNTLSLFYTYKGIWATNLKQTYNYYQSKQRGFDNTKFDNTTITTSLSTSVNPVSKWNIGTNVNFNRATSSAGEATNFTIWNAYTSYRFLKGNNLEFKFSAMDLLHQNRSVFNSGNNNMITQRWTNTLQQYFMVGIAYFPRKFGKSEKSRQVDEGGDE